MTPKEKEEWKATRKQLLPVFMVQLLTAIALLVTIFYGGYYHCNSISLPSSNEFSDKLQFSLRWCAFPFAVVLMFTIMGVSNKRGSTPAANPLSGNDHLLQVEKNILTNTLEQIVLAFFIILALTVYLEDSEMKLVPIYVLSFIAGRALFIGGYKIGPQFRSCGVLLNMGSTVLMLGVIGYTIYSRGLLAASTGKDEL